MGIFDKFKKKGNQQQSQPSQQQASPQQTQQNSSGGGSFGTKTLNIVWPKSHLKKINSILVFIGLIIILVYYKIVSLDAITKIIAGFLFALLILWGFMDKSDDSENSKYVALVFLIWVIDLASASTPVIGFLGPPYAGFKLGLVNLLQTDWVSLFTFPVFIIALFIGGVRNFFKRNYWATWFAFGLMFLLNKLFSFAGILSIQLSKATLIGPFVNYTILVVMLISLILAWKYRGYSNENVSDFLTFLFLILVGSFFWLNSSWMSSWKAWIHMIFILIFGFVYIREKEKKKSVYHILIPVLLIADFFVYNLAAILGNTLNGVQFFPVLVLIVLIYCYDKTPNSRYLTFSFWFIFIIIGLLVAPKYASALTGSNFETRQGEGIGNAWNELKNNIYRTVQGQGKTVTDSITKRLDYATGGLYNGYVEQNQYVNLGVYFANVRASEPKFYTDEPVILYGSIQSKTYQDPVKIDFNCYRWTDNDKRKIPAEEVTPKNSFLAFQLEENDVECSFIPKANKESFKPGYNKVTLEASYNFGTDGYIKSYFIDEQKRRALVRQSIDPLAQFGIEDKAPKPVFTNGPVEIGINVQPLVSVSNNYPVLPAISVSLINRQQTEDKDSRIISTWDGRIKNIKELVILTPPGVQIGDGGVNTLCNDENYKPHQCPCNRPFKTYNENDCKTSCKNNVLDPCNEACASAGGNCAEECKRVSDKCELGCDEMFIAGSNPAQRYTGYELDISKLKEDAYKDIGKQKNPDDNSELNRYRTFTCFFKPTQSALDSNVPLTTRYFRVRARYDYLLQKTFSITVEQSPYFIGPTSTDFDAEIPDEKYTKIMSSSGNSNEETYSPIALSAAKFYNVDYFLVKSIIQQESNWDPTKVGRRGEIGLMQVLPSTASGYKCKDDWKTNPESNIDCGVRYLRDLINYQNNNNVKKGVMHIVAGYNGDKEAMQYSTDIRHESEAKWENKNNPGFEVTRDYVPKVMQNYAKLTQQLTTN